MRECSFCGASESPDTRIMAGNGAYICEHCITTAHRILFGDSFENEQRSVESKIEHPEFLAPKYLKETLDDFVIGQDRAKKVISDRKSVV